MKYDGYYLVEVLIPETYSLSMKSGCINYCLCTKDGDKFHDIITNNSYCKDSGFGNPEVMDYIPFSEFYNRLGLKRIIVKKRAESNEAYKLVKEHKKVLKKANK